MRQLSKITEDFFRALTPGQVSLALTLAMHMELYGLSPADLISMAEEYLEVARQAAAGETPAPVRQGRHVAPSCPACGSSLRLYAVNVSKCTAVGGDWQTSQVCANPSCRHTSLSKKNIKELLHGL